MNLSFKSAAAAEMLLRTDQGAKCSLELVDAKEGRAWVRLHITLNGVPVMISDETRMVFPGDTIEVPSILEVQFSTV